MSRALAFAAFALFLPTAAPGDDRPAGAILEELQAITLPARPDVGDSASVRAYVDAMKKVRERRAPLILELFRADPEHPELTKLLPVRWQDLLELGRDDTLPAEADEAIARRAGDAALKVEAAYWLAFRVNYANRLLREKDIAGARAATDAFIALAPADPRGASLLKILAGHTLGDERRAVEDRILRDYPESKQAATVAAQHRAAEAVGKPFDLEFTDAITGEAVSVRKTLKGKVVVVDFWATWCGPCVAEMPALKKLYAEYRDKGVEFLGVSLDAPEDMGGLKALKAYVADNAIPWPQYYQGRGWDGEFSRSWGINAIPQTFLIDADGKLVTREARGRLETLLPEQLKAAADR